MGTEVISVTPTSLDMRATDTPNTALEALMRAPPGEAVEESNEEILSRRETVLKLVDDAWDQLDPIEREIIDAYFFEHVSLRKIAARYEGRYGKTWIAHLRDRALGKMREHLQTNSDMFAYIDHGWEQ